ncbi:MAG TPA: glycine cleavage T C-terminal barrel domain-containing protein [Anaerolineales bacterium]|nr:glycine cleavage T C-terminal barrel domain-containing protein [Anaerolineales bacterium]
MTSAGELQPHTVESTWSTELEAAYRAAFESALCVLHPPPGLIRVEGSHRLDLLHRMSTNDLIDLPAGSIRATVLTTPLARIVDRVWVWAAEDHLLLLTGPHRAETVSHWLRRHIFFQDDVQLKQEQEDWTLWGLYGPAAWEEAARIFPEVTRPAGGVATAIDGGLYWALDAPAAGGLRLLLDPSSSLRADAAWNERNAGSLAWQAYEIHRVEAGLAETGHEILEDYIPLEVGLEHDVSFTKGCYIGQEIIARMESRGRRARSLLGVRLAAGVPELATVSQGAQTVGTVTSVAKSPRLGWVALAVVRPTALESENGRVTVGQDRVAGELVELPFAAS